MDTSLVEIHSEDVQDFELLKTKFLEIGKQLEVEQTFLNLKKSLRELLPNTFDSIENICENTGFTQSKVKSMLYEMRRKLRKYLESEDIEV